MNRIYLNNLKHHVRHIPCYRYNTALYITPSQKKLGCKHLQMDIYNIYIYIYYIHMYTCLLNKPFLVMVGLNQASRSPTISSWHTIHLSNHLQLYPHHVWCSTHDHPVQQSDYLSTHTYLRFILNHPVFSCLAMARSCYCCLVKIGKDYPSYSAASNTCPEKWT